MENLFKAEWEKIDRSETHPRRLRNVVKMPWAEFKEKVLTQDPSFVRETVRSIYAGDTYILQNAYPKDFCNGIKHKAFEWGKTMPSSFHKMFEDCPDFHRVVTPELAKNYSFDRVMHHYYFFRWNSDPLNIWKPINERWSILKFLGGFQLNEYVNNTPKDGIVDRIHVHHYPSGSGEIETHSDPYENQRTIMGAQISEKGSEYKSGGLYFIDQNGKKVNVDDEIKIGDLYISFPTVHHGVEIIDKGAKVDWENMRGRWFLGLYSAVSDEVKNRHTAYRVPDVKNIQEKQSYQA